jgi:hypothetical protein
MEDLSERMYCVEDRVDAFDSTLNVALDAARTDMRVLAERIDGLRETLEREFQKDRKHAGADRKFLYALVKDHNRRIRALERLEKRNSRYRVCPN